MARLPQPRVSSPMLRPLEEKGRLRAYSTEARRGRGPAAVAMDLFFCYFSRRSSAGAGCPTAVGAPTDLALA